MFINHANIILNQVRIVCVEDQLDLFVYKILYCISFEYGLSEFISVNNMIKHDKGAWIPVEERVTQLDRKSVV